MMVGKSQERILQSCMVCNHSLKYLRRYCNNHKHKPTADSPRDLESYTTASKGLSTIAFKRQLIPNLHRIVLLNILTEANNLILQSFAIIASPQEVLWPSRAFRTVHAATGRHMVSFVIGEGSFLVSTPRGCTAVMRIF
jgi:hypothetical protein